jgi:hypothetical protein
MKKVIRLTELDLTRIVRRIVKENLESNKTNFKIGDMFKVTLSTGAHIRFKLIKGGGKYWEATIVGVYGNWPKENPYFDSNPNLRSPKIGDPVKLDLSEDGYFVLYLPKTNGEREAYSHGLSHLEKLN